MSFLYDDQGLHTQKVVGETTISYTWSGTTLLSEATDTYILIYLYDESASPIGFQYKTATTTETYLYEKNLQGDIVAVYRNDGTKLISYAYDAWGNANISFHNGGENTNATKNPFTYRGYYYDQDLGLYYLQSRYYDAKVGRFISADEIAVITASPTALTDKNLYAYCDNNPVMRGDGDGEFWDTVFDVVSLVISVVDVIQNPDDVWAWVGLAGDVLDLIPFVTGLGEAADVFRVATRIDGVVDTIDGFGDAIRTIDGVEDAVDATKVGWKVGDDITNLTKAGKRPSWTTVRQRYWKNEAYYNPARYNQEALELMKKGRAPIVDGFPLELHHPHGRNGKNYFDFIPLTKADHILEHQRLGWRLN